MFTSFLIYFSCIEVFYNIFCLMQIPQLLHLTQSRYWMRMLQVSLRYQNKIGRAIVTVLHGGRRTYQIISVHGSRVKIAKSQR